MNREQLEELPRVEIERLFNSFVDLHPVRVQAFLQAVEATGWDRGLFDFSVASMDRAAKWFVERYWPGADHEVRVPLPTQVIEKAGEVWWSNYDREDVRAQDRVVGSVLAGSYMAEVALRDVPGSFFYLMLDVGMADAFVPKIGPVSFQSRLVSTTYAASSAGADVDFSAIYLASFRDSIVRTTSNRESLKSVLIGVPSSFERSASASELAAGGGEVSEHEGPEVGVGGGVVSIVHDLMADDDRLDRFRTLLYAAFGHVSFEDNEIVEFEIDDESGVSGLVERLWVQSLAG